MSVAFLAGGCNLLAPYLPQMPASGDGCSPQVPASYRVQATVPTGTLEVRVFDAGGTPRASASVHATRMAASGTRGAMCVSMVSGTTDATGKVRFERMKTGPYRVMLAEQGQDASGSAEVVADQTTAVSLVRR